VLHFTKLTLNTLVAAAALGFAANALALDEKAAKEFFRENDCTKCHAPDKAKKGPSLTKIAADLKGKPDAEAHIIKQITTGPKIKFADGSEDTHKKVSGDDATLKNVAAYILSFGK
jgi:cytochrome c